MQAAIDTMLHGHSEVMVCSHMHDLSGISHDPSLSVMFYGCGWMAHSVNEMCEVER